MIKRDVVWWWKGGTEKGRWHAAAAGNRTEIRRMGYVAHDGSLTIGPPEGPPSQAQLNEVLKLRRGEVPPC